MEAGRAHDRKRSEKVLRSSSSSPSSQQQLTGSGGGRGREGGVGSGWAKGGGGLLKAEEGLRIVGRKIHPDLDSIRPLSLTSPFFLIL